MVLAVLNSDPSLCHQESFSAEKFFVVAPQNLKPSNRRSRAHNIPGGIKHLLSDPKRRRRISVRSTALPFSTAPQPFSHRSHPRLRSTRLHHHHKAANRVAQKTLSASATPASETQNPPSPSQPQSHASTVPIDVTFPRRLSELPHKQISPEVLASLGYTAEVPSQYIRDQMERLGPMYVFDLFHYISLNDKLVLACIRLYGLQRHLYQGQRCPRHLPSTSMAKHRCLPHIWQRSTLLPRLVRSHGVS